MTLKYDGQLEIDQVRGVIYFHDKQGVTLLRICSLPKPIPTPLTVKSADKDYVKWPPEINPLDITFGYGVSWASIEPGFAGGAWGAPFEKEGSLFIEHYRNGKVDGTYLIAEKE